MLNLHKIIFAYQYLLFIISQYIFQIYFKIGVSPNISEKRTFPQIEMNFSM